VDPFEPQPDGAGTIFPFWVEGAGDRPGYIELPYTLVQDSTLFLFLRERSIRLWKLKLDWVARHGGMVLVNTHPDYMGFRSSEANWREYPAAFYSELLKYLREEYQGKYWHALPGEVAEWFQTTRKSLTNAAAKSNPEAISSTQKPSVLEGKRAASILFSDYPGDPRPRRAAEALQRAGMTVDVLCLCEEGQPKGWETVNGVNVYRTPLRRQREGKIRYLLQYASFLLGATWFLASRSLRTRYHVVHVHNMPDFLVFSSLVPKLLGAKVILDLHDPMPELYQSLYGLSPQHWAPKLLRWVEKWSIGIADLALTPNIAFRDLFAKRSCRLRKVKVIMNSPDEEIFHSEVRGSGNLPALPDGERCFQILFHGSLLHRHGLDTAVEALLEAQQLIPNIRLLICGARTPYLDSVLELARVKGVGDRVSYLGMKTEREIARIIATADLGVIPNRRSLFTEINMPTRIFEFLALGKPVIAPSTRGIRDYFGDGDLLFFEPGAATDLARQFVRVYQSPDEVARIVRRGQEVYRRNMWHTNRRRFVRLVADLLE